MSMATPAGVGSLSECENVGACKNLLVFSSETLRSPYKTLCRMYVGLPVEKLDGL